MKNKHTAVEFLDSQFNENGKLTPVDFYQAKAKEKEQLKNAYWYGEYDGHNGSDRNFEQYYNETYGKDEND